MRRRCACLVVFAVLWPAVQAIAAEHPSLAMARTLYNRGDLNGAIAAATLARSDAASADAAALVIGRSYLERFRQLGEPSDLASARENLSVVRVSALMPRDQLDLEIGLGQALFLGESFGAAAELFDVALSRSALLPASDRLQLLEWWASASSREAQQRPADRRAVVFERVLARMEEEVRTDPGSAPANYWIAAASRGIGDLDRAWHTSIAGWIRATLSRATAAVLRADLDRLVTEALIPELSRLRPAREQADAAAALRAEWDQVKEQWPLQ